MGCRTRSRHRCRVRWTALYACGEVIGCLESFVSGWAIAREAQLVCTTADGDRIRTFTNGGKADARAVTLAANEGIRRR